MATAAVIGRLVVNIEARYQQLSKSLRAASDSVSTFASRVNRQVSQAGGILGRVLGVAGTVSLGTFSAAVVRSTQAIDELNDASGKLGVTTEALTKLRWSGKMTGVDFATMDASVQKMVTNISKAAVGTGDAQKALDELGLSARRLVNLGADQQFQMIADAIDNVANHADKMRLTLAIFGKGSGGLLNTFEGGAASIGKMADEAERLGLVVSNEDAKKVAELADAWDRFTAAAGGAGNRLTIEIAPAAAEALNGFAIALGDFNAREATSKAGNAGAFVTEGMPNVQRFWDWVFQDVGNARSGRALTPAERSRVDAVRGTGVDDPIQAEASSNGMFGKVAESIRSATQFFTDAAQQADKALYANIEPARIFAEDALRKIEKEMERTEQLESFGKQLTEQFMDPWERLDKQRKDIADAFGRKLITEAVAFEANAQADRDFEANRREWEQRNGQEPGQRRELSLLESGTNEAFAALRRNMQGGTSDKILDVNKKQLEANKQAVDHLKALADQFKLLQAVGIN